MHLLLVAGEIRLALPADRVVRLAPAGEGSRSLAAALGREPHPGPGAGAVEVAGLPVPLLADRVLGVTATGDASFAALPAGTRLSRPVIGRALLLPAGVFLELDPDRLGSSPPPLAAPHTAPPGPAVLEPVRALVFRVVERRFAVAFSLVQAVLQEPEIVEVPLAPAAHRGVILHSGSLLPVFDLPALLLGRRGRSAPYVVLVDVGGEATGLAADEVEGIAELHPPEDVTHAGAPGGAFMVGPSGEEVLLAACDRLFAHG